jgi:hypothetical protein
VTVVAITVPFDVVPVTMTNSPFFIAELVTVVDPFLYTVVEVTATVVTDLPRPRRVISLSVNATTVPNVPGPGPPCPPRAPAPEGGAPFAPFDGVMAAAVLIAL